MSIYQETPDTKANKCIVYLDRLIDNLRTTPSILYTSIPAPQEAYLLSAKSDNYVQSIDTKGETIAYNLREITLELIADAATSPEKKEILEQKNKQLAEEVKNAQAKNRLFRGYL